MKCLPWTPRIAALVGILLLVTPAIGKSAPTLSAPEAVTLPLSLHWKYSAAEIGLPSQVVSAPPSIDNGVLYLCLRTVRPDGIEAGAVCAVSAETGERLWTRILEGVALGSPCVSDGTLWVADTRGNLYALDLSQDGAERARFHLRGSSQCSPVVQDGVVYVGDESGTVLAVDVKSMEERWRFRANGPVKVPIAVSPALKLAYVCSGAPALYAVRLDKGTAVWAQSMPEIVDSTPLLWGNYVFVASGSNLMCLAAQRGLVLWSSTALRSTSGYRILGTPALGEDARGLGARLYFTCQDGSLNALSARTGSMAWKRPILLEQAPKGSPAITRDALLVGGQGGYLFAVDPTKGSKVLWKYRLVPPPDIAAGVPTAGVMGTPLVTNGRVFVVGDEGTLFCLAPEAVDQTPPVVQELYLGGIPIARHGSINGYPPLIFSAWVSDEGSGVDPSRLVMKIDGAVVAHKYEPRTGEISYRIPAPDPPQPLASGAHSVSITAADLRGNTKEYDWAFTVFEKTLLPSASFNGENAPE